MKPVFTIDATNNITAHAELPAGAEGAFSTAKEFAKLTAEWPVSRLMETWNSFAGVPPFQELKPVKEFTSRKAAVARIFQAVERLSSATGEPAPTVAPVKGKGKKAPAKGKRRDTARPAAKEAGTNKRAEVVTLMKRAKGVTLAEIMETTGWQAHTVRGFVSILGSKSDFKIESTKTETGGRTYRIAK